MESIFESVHSMPENELEGKPHDLPDSEQVRALRRAEGYSGRMALGQALCRQLRYRDAIAVYTEAIAMNPEDPEAYRQRAARHIATMQPERAISDLKFCLPLSMEKSDIYYRMGIARYLAGQYLEAMDAEQKAFPGFDDEMGVAAMFWHTAAAWKAGTEPTLLKHYRQDMEVGHHTAYHFSMGLAAGETMLEQALERISKEKSDLEYSIMGYGAAMFAEAAGKNDIAKSLLEAVVKRDGFWISYGYLAAWNEVRK